MKSVQERAFLSYRHNNPLLNHSGFNLVELMVVVAIIAVLLAVAVPVYEAVKTYAAEEANEANMRIIHGAVQMYIADHGVPDGAFTSEQWEEKLKTYLMQEWPDPPPGYAGRYKVNGGFQNYTISGVTKAHKNKE
ncbi:putative major pilin subunit [Sporotomaculum syntrophicum]|uniref:Major pilin subunit n=1 Tax=Sporotomaculum syntrophicum TaxID=182264 RepID=A0A9D2WSI9_9FIRM|nr:type II secretion system protein [Sporotomaculum syntrophicum]KAF1086573.1 putative major pilin subunit [Sporotomaculum syntrophicum]